MFSLYLDMQMCLYTPILRGDHPQAVSLSMFLYYHRKLIYIIICGNLVQSEMHSRKIALSLEMSYAGQNHHQNKKCDNNQFTHLCWAKILISDFCSSGCFLTVRSVHSFCYYCHPSDTEMQVSQKASCVLKTD